MRLNWYNQVRSCISPFYLHDSAVVIRLKCQINSFTVKLDLWQIIILQCMKLYHVILTSDSTNQKDVYKITNGLLFTKSDKKLPSSDSVNELAEKFANYFVEKIVTIRNGLQSEAQVSGKNEVEYSLESVIVYTCYRRRNIQIYSAFCFQIM